jgi:hypothetical protein
VPNTDHFLIWQRLSEYVSRREPSESAKTGIQPVFGPSDLQSLGLRTLQDQWAPQNPAEVGVFAEVCKRQCCRPCVTALPAPAARLMNNFCPFLLSQGLPSPRLRDRHSAASHPATHLLKNRYEVAPASGNEHECGAWEEPKPQRGILDPQLSFGLNSLILCVQGS